MFLPIYYRLIYFVPLIQGFKSINEHITLEHSCLYNLKPLLMTYTRRVLEYSIFNPLSVQENLVAVEYAGILDLFPVAFN